MRILCTIATLWIGLSMLTYAQTIEITDATSGKAIELATLISNKPKAIATTNAVGKADVQAFRGAEQIQIHMYGYKTKTLSYATIAANEFKVSLTIDNFNMDEVVVSASRWRQFANDIPSKITSISPQEVSLQNPQTAADLLGISGKVYIQKSQQGGGSPMIRGFAANRLLYTIDGVRMNTAIFRGGNIQNVISLDPFAIEDTEILFGPGSVIYGSDAIGGVMSFQTLRPKLSLKDSVYISGNAFTRYATANQEKTGHIDINIGWTRWAMVSSLSTSQYDNLRQGSNGPADYLKPYYVQREDTLDKVIYQDDPLLQIPTAYQQLNIMQKIRFQPSDSWDFSYGFHFSETSSYGRYDRHNRNTNELPRYGEWSYGPQKWRMNNLHITHQAATALYDDLSVRLAQQYFEESRIERSLNSLARSKQLEKVLAYSINVDLSKTISKRNTLFYGAEYVLNDVSSSGEITNISTMATQLAAARYPQAQWRAIGAYLNHEFKMNKEVTIQAGLRYNQFFIDAAFDTTFYPFPFTEATINDGALTGSVGLVYRPTEQWVLRINSGSAFRAPNVDDIGKVFDSEPGAVTLPNPELSAEYAYNIEGGITKIFGDLIKTDITAYYTLLNNAIVRRGFQLNGLDSILYAGQLSQVQALQNAAMAKVWGIQASIELKLAHDLTFSTDLNYQKGEEALDNGDISPSRHAAPFFGLSRLNYQAKKLQLQLYCHYQAERAYDELAVEERRKDEIYAKDKNGNNYAPAWYTVNFKAQYLLNKSFTANAGVENITDQRYRPYSAGISAAGRSFIFSIKASF
ncbi:MAG: hemoglobin/transferrin/lactoferrin receptor protein [Marivirga sp.]|jgi:hemoglobin/transferrin/lactoferrin receptor protein